MSQFEGFPEGQVHLVPIPQLFFVDLLPHIDHLGELKLTLHIFWLLSSMEGSFRYVRKNDLIRDDALKASLQSAGSNLDEATRQAIRRSTLLEASFDNENGQEICYFLNSPKGRAAMQAIQNGHWRFTDNPDLPILIEPARPNIFQLYEENIGPLTPLLADSLREAKEIYNPDWIEDAIRIAVERNKRHWRYIVAILERWQREGRDVRREKQKDRRDSEEDRRRYIEGEFSDFIEH